MLTARRRSTLAALTAGIIVTLVPTAAGACDGWDGWDRWPGHGGQGGGATELTLVYVYQKVDAAAPASWENSGEQHLIQVRDGLSWTDTIDVSLLPAGVCGDGWAIQEDQTRGLARDAVPQVIDRRTGVGQLTWPPIVAARHTDLSAYMDVPSCTPVTPPVVTPPVVTPPVVTPPVVTPPVVTPPVVTPPVVTPPVVTPPVVSPSTVVPGAAKPAQPVVAAPAFTG